MRHDIQEPFDLAIKHRVACELDSCCPTAPTLCHALLSAVWSERCTTAWLLLGAVL